MEEIKIRLVKDDNGEFYFKYGNRNIARTAYGLTSILEEGIQNGEIAHGIKIIDDKHIKYVFNLYNSNEFKAVQKPVKIEVRIRKEYADSVYDSLKSLDSICMTTNYIRAKNVSKILAITLATITFLSFAGDKIINRIKYPLGDHDNKKYYHDDKTYEEHLNDYYEELRKKAESGDEEAIKEYNRYLLQLNLNKIYDEEINNKKISR